MKIIILNDHAHVNGGAAQVAITELNAFADLGFDVTFISSTGPVAVEIDQSRIRVVNFGFHDLLGNPSRLDAAIQGLWNFRSARRLGDILNDFDPANTIVHLHTWSKSLTSSVVKETKRRGFKLVCTLHDYFAVCPNGGLYNYQKGKNCLLKPMSIECAMSNCDARSYPQKVWRFVRHILQEQLGGIPKEIDYFITVSEFSELLMRPYLPLGAKIFRVKNPIVIPKLPPATPEANEAFCFVGRLVPEKGGVIFAAAAKKAGVPAIFIGSGVEERAIRAVNPDVEIHGWCDRSGVINAIRASRALVFPSLLYETYGLVVAEATALGVPVLVSVGCSARETIVHNATGLLFKTGDVDDLAEKLHLLRIRPELAGQMGRKAYEHYWSAPVTLENHILELIACYRKILS